MLAPLPTCGPAVAEKLAETLRSWLLHQGRREDVAAELFVHPQTVRYRMGSCASCTATGSRTPAGCCG